MPNSKRSFTFFLFSLLILILINFISPFYSFSQSEETITVTTYYPAPYGVYKEMRATRMAVGGTYYNASAYPCDTGGGCAGNEICNEVDLVVEGRVGIGTTAPHGMLDVRWGQVAIGTTATSPFTGPNYNDRVYIRGVPLSPTYSGAYALMAEGGGTSGIFGWTAITNGLGVGGYSERRIGVKGESYAGNYGFALGGTSSPALAAGVIGQGDYKTTGIVGTSDEGISGLFEASNHNSIPSPVPTLVTRRVSGQTSDLFQAMDENNNVLVSITASGKARSSNLTVGTDPEQTLTTKSYVDASIGGGAFVTRRMRMGDSGSCSCIMYQPPWCPAGGGPYTILDSWVYDYDGGGGGICIRICVTETLCQK